LNNRNRIEDFNVLKKSSIGFLFLILSLGCGEPSEVEMEVPISGKLVYVEDFGGRQGVLAGRFGDLVLIEGNENKRYALTDDHYYYAYPNLVNGGKEVWFESKRGDDLWPAGLSSRSDLYSLDVETRQVRNIRDSLSTVFAVPLEDGIERISVSPSGSRMVFQMRDVETGSPIGPRPFFYLDRDFNMLRRVEDETYRISWMQVFWSDDENKISFDSGGHRRVFVYNFERQQAHRISNEFIESIQRPMFCHAGSWIDDNRFVYSCSYSGGNEIKIFQYDYHTDSSTEIAEIVKENFGIQSLHISRDGSYLVFIGTTSVDFKIVESAIYVYDIETNEMQSFAENKRQKRWLRWYEDF